MLVPEAAKLKKKRWAVVYPNYEYGQSAAATFKELLKKAQPDVEFVAEQAPPLGKIDAGAVVQALADAKPDAIFNVLFGADLSKFVREGNTRGLFKGREVVSLLTGEPEYLDPLKDEAPERLDRHRLPVVRHPDRRAQGVLPRLLPRSTTTTRASARWSATRRSSRSPRASRRPRVDRHREADRGLQGPAVRHRRSARSPTARSTTSRRWAPIVGKTKLEGGKGVMVDYRLPRRRQVPAERRRGEEAARDDRARLHRRRRPMLTARVELVGLRRPAAQRAGRRVVAVPGRAGLSLIFGVTRIVNFAHGSFYMLGRLPRLHAGRARSPASARSASGRRCCWRRSSSACSAR